MPGSKYEEFLRSQQSQRGLLPMPSIPRTPQRSKYEEFLEEQRIAAVQPRDDSVLGKVKAIRGNVSRLGQEAVKDASLAASFAINPALGMERVAEVRARGEEPFGLTRTLASGLVDTGADALRILENPVGAFGRFKEEAGGSTLGAVGRTANAASLAAGPLARVLGLGPKMAWVANAVTDAGVGALTTPDDPIVGAGTGFVVGQAGEVAGAAKRGYNRLRGGSPSVPATAAPAVATPKTRTISEMPVGEREEIAQGLAEVFNEVKSSQRTVTPTVTGGRRRVASDAASAEAAAQAQRQVAQDARVDAGEIEPQSFGGIEGGEDLTGRLPKSRIDLQRLMRGNRVKPDQAAEILKQRVLARNINKLFEGVNEQLDGIGTPVDEAFAKTTQPIVPAYPGAFPEGASFGSGMPRGTTYDNALGNILDDDLMGQVRGSADREARAAAAAVPVQPRRPAGPRATEPIPEGFFMPDPVRAPVEAVPHDARGARVIFNDGAERTGARSASGGSGTGSPDFDAVDEAFNRYLDGLAKIKVSVGKRQQIADVFATYQRALQETGDHNIAMELFENNRDRGLINKALGGKKPVKVNPNTPTVDTPGVQALKSNKVVDFRNRTEDDLFEELREQQRRIEAAERDMNEGTWLREDVNGSGSQYSVVRMGHTRQYGRGKARSNQAARMADAVDRELRARLTAKGMAPEEIDSVIIAARFGDTAPTLRGPRVFDGETLPDEAFVGREAEWEPLPEDPIPDTPGNAGPGLGTMDEGVPSRPVAQNTAAPSPFDVENYASIRNASDADLRAGGDLDMDAFRAVGRERIEAAKRMSDDALAAEERRLLGELQRSRPETRDAAVELIDYIQEEMENRGLPIRDFDIPEIESLSPAAVSARDADVDAATPAGAVQPTAPVTAAAAASPIAAPRAAAFEPTVDAAKKPYVNWRTLADRNGPLGVATATRLQEAVTKNAQRLAEERGYMGFADQRDAAMKSDVVRELFDNPLMIDRKKLEGLSGAQVVAVKDIAQENARMADMIAQDIESGTLGAEDLTKATELLERLNDSTNEALATIVGESARMGRDLGYLRNLSRLSTDAATWKVMAKKRLGDRPLTMEMQLKIERLAKEAAEACA